MDSWLCDLLGRPPPDNKDPWDVPGSRKEGQQHKLIGQCVDTCLPLSVLARVHIRKSVFLADLRDRKREQTSQIPTNPARGGWPYLGALAIRIRPRLLGDR